MVKAPRRDRTSEAKRIGLEQIANQLADALSIDPEYVMTDAPNNRISISAKQAARIVRMLRGEE